ncbi:MAG: DUF2183 domain-containing protein [Propioniciclava sp.]|uniref:App1 family protein n=1 Tax=Propioniciclava sp. TaxID=2038686 RepID=UPI0039E721AD
MSNRPFIAARIEVRFDRVAERFFRALGWQERVIPYTAYGDESFVRVLGRVVLTPKFSNTHLGKAAESFLYRRGWRNFFTAVCVHARYTIRVGDAEATGTTDRGGYIDHRVRGHGLEPGWQTAQVRTAYSPASTMPVQVIGSGVRFGIVSDIDDTILTTMLPRPMVAAWNSFVRIEATRQAVPGMAQFYREVLRHHPGAPVIYLSTGAWNTHGFLSRFIARHRYPVGPMLLTDWGPTNTGWFRSGPEHKRAALLQLVVDFPRVRWLLVGDDGQHDPEVYGEFASANPGNVAGIAIRQLTPAEQILAHGTIEPLPVEAEQPAGIPVIRAEDGRGLQRQAAGLLPRD